MENFLHMWGQIYDPDHIKHRWKDFHYLIWLTSPSQVSRGLQLALLIEFLFTLKLWIKSIHNLMSQIHFHQLIFPSVWPLNDRMCGMKDVGPVRSEGKKTESPHDGLPENKIIKRLKSDCLATHFHLRGIRPGLIFGRCCCYFLFHGSTLDVNLVQFANHKHLVKFSLAKYMISLWTQTLWLCLGITKPWLCLGTTNISLHL